MNEWINECKDLMNERRHNWMHESFIEWMSEWLNELKIKVSIK